MRSTPARPFTLILPAAVLVLGLSACGGGNEATVNSPQPGATVSSSHGPAATGPHNEADVAFATDMIPHHAQAVEMAALALERATNDQIRQLASAIQAAQDPEIKTMSGWLAGWGEQVPSAEAGSGTGGHGGGHSMSSGTGMMTAEQMEELSKGSGAEFDRLWLEMMTEHHEGALEMSRTQLADGQNPAAKALAQQIIDGQTREITTMAQLAKSLA